MVFINYDNKSLFIHIPKCGNKSLFIHIPKCGGCYTRKIYNYYNYEDFLKNKQHHKLYEYCDNIDENIYDKHTITSKDYYNLAEAYHL